MIIYKLTSPSGKSYIGQTANTVHERFKQHMLAAHNPNAPDQRKLHLALRKYSNTEQWDKQIIFETDDYQLLLDKEIEMIDTYKTISEGYNAHVGGLGGSFGLANSEQHNQAISEGRKKFFQTAEGLAWKQQLRDKALGNEYGKLRVNTKHSEQTKRKIGASNSKQWIVTFPDGHTERVTNLNAFCREHKLQMQNLCQTQPGGRSSQHRGFKVIRLSKSN